MKKFLKLLPLVVVASLTACEKYKYSSNTLLVFGTVCNYTLQLTNDFAGGKTYSSIENILKDIDKYADATKQRDVTNIWSLNRTNEKLKIDEEFYNLLKRANELKESLKYFNPLIGSLSEEWKSALNLSENPNYTPEVLSNSVIEAELAKINSSELILEKTEEGYFAQRTGDAQIDLGAVAKGYALDRCLLYFQHHTGNTGDRIINLGNSSILLGRNSKEIKVFNSPEQYEEGVYVVEIPNLVNENRLRLYNSFISTSGISEQKAVVDGVTYSHIINPVTGSAKVGNYDQITVITPDVWNKGALGDALSTSLMMGDENDIKEAETNFEVKVIAIKGGNIVYKSDGVTLYN